MLPPSPSSSRTTPTMTHGGGEVDDEAPDCRRHHRLQPPPPPLLSTFHLLEITIISAQDLNPTCGYTRAYAVAWVDPNYQLHTSTDRTGRTNPNWNDKFVFRVDDEFLHSDTASVNIVIRRASLVCGWHDQVIGTTRLLISTASPSTAIRFVALQVRRPKSLRPQGILNLGVAVRSDVGAARGMAFRRTISSMKAWESRAYDRDSEKRGDAARWAVDKEREALQLKLEKWRKEISPGEVDPRQNVVEPEKKRRRKEAEGKLFGCFSGRSGRWD